VAEILQRGKVRQVRPDVGQVPPAQVGRLVTIKPEKCFFILNYFNF
jgi:hypothetical protein